MSWFFWAIEIWSTKTSRYFVLIWTWGHNLLELDEEKGEEDARSSYWIHLDMNQPMQGGKTRDMEMQMQKKPEWLTQDLQEAGDTYSNP
jgi:hypothetical protein